MPVSVAVSAAVLGMLNGLFQIGWIILSAVFLYNITVESGQLEIIKGSISLLSTDRRIQAILIAFCFSAFMEGTTGMGAPVAVCAAMMIGIGFPPLVAALICLAGNTQSVPFGTVGVPTIMMTSVTGISDHVLARAVGNDVVVLALIIPVFVVVVLAGWRSAMEVLPAALVAGGTYAVTCFLVIRIMGVELPSILSSFVSAMHESTESDWLALYGVCLTCGGFSRGARCGLLLYRRASMRVPGRFCTRGEETIWYGRSME